MMTNAFMHSPFGGPAPAGGHYAPAAPAREYASAGGTYAPATALLSEGVYAAAGVGKAAGPAGGASGGGGSERYGTVTYGTATTATPPFGGGSEGSQYYKASQYGVLAKAGTPPAYGNAATATTPAYGTAATASMPAYGNAAENTPSYGTVGANQ